MSNYLPNFYKAFLATALNAGTAASTVVVDRITTLTGETLETGDLSVLGKGVITVNPDADGLTSYPENISFTGVTSATKTLTGAVRGLDKAGVTQTSLMRYFPVGTPVIVSFGVHEISDLITYLNTLVVSTRSVIVTGTAGETVAAGNLVYMDDTDNEWKKCDADTAATVENTMLGIAQGAGVDGGQIATGILLLGKDLTNSGLTAGQKYYASNTAGGISSSPGTKEVTIGFGSVDGYLYFEPRFDQQLTEDEQDALAGSGGTPSATNPFGTKAGYQSQSGVYYTSAVGTDAYAITPAPAIGSYVAGQRFCFRADVANTGNATLAISGLAAKNILKGHDQTLATGDIEIGQFVDVIYDATADAFQMQSPVGIPAVPFPLIAIGLTGVAIVSSTTETTLFTTTIPGGTLGTGNAVHFKLNITLFGMTDTKTCTLRLKYGGTTVITLVATYDGTAGNFTFGNGYIEGYLFANASASAQKGFLQINASSQGNTFTDASLFAFTGSGNGTSAEASAGDLTFALTAQFNTNSVQNYLTTEFYTIERIQIS